MLSLLTNVTAKVLIQLLPLPMKPGWQGKVELLPLDQVYSSLLVKMRGPNYIYRQLYCIIAGGYTSFPGVGTGTEQVGGGVGGYQGPPFSSAERPGKRIIQIRIEG